MPRLADLQALFASALAEPDKIGIEDWIRTEDISAGRRIAVYRNNSRISQTEALAGIYPAIQQLVGEEFFEHMAEYYGAKYPSTSGDLRDYGESLAQFLSAFEPAAQLPYLPDVARLEWAWHECFHAATTKAADSAVLKSLANEAAENARLSLIPASRLLISDYPIARIWEFALNPSQQQEKLDLDALGDSRLLIARSADSVNVMELTPGQFFWLDLINAGVTLETLFEQTMHSYPDFDFAVNLATFVELGVIMIQQKHSSAL